MLERDGKGTVFLRFWGAAGAPNPVFFWPPIVPPFGPKCTPFWPTVSLEGGLGGLDQKWFWTVNYGNPGPMIRTVGQRDERAQETIFVVWGSKTSPSKAGGDRR